MIAIWIAVLAAFVAASLGFLLCAMLTAGKTADLEAENLRLRLRLDRVAVDLLRRAQHANSRDAAEAYEHASDAIREVLREGLE